MWTCPSCNNTENENDWERCWNCGNARSAPALPEAPANAVGVIEVRCDALGNYAAALAEVTTSAAALGRDRLISISSTTIGSVVTFQIWHWTSDSRSAYRSPG